MNVPIKKLKTGFEMPVIGLGTWLMGGNKLRNPNNDDEKDIKAVKEAISVGITHLDTAENYAEGWAEKIVGKAIKNYKRDNLFITSKVDKTNLHFNDVINACKNSLGRLGTNYLDLYLIHAPNDEVPIEETMRAMDQLVTDGLVKNIGVSNFKTGRLIEAQKYTKNKIVANQVFYNLVEREPEIDGLLDYVQKNDVLLTAYRPIGKGALLENVPQIIKDLSKKYNKSFAQIMLNWLMSQENVVTVTKMAKLEHVKENLGAIGWQLEKPDIEKLRKEFPNQINHSDVLPLR